MGEMLVAFLARMPNPFGWVSRAAQNDGWALAGLSVLAALLVWFLAWKILSSLFALSGPGARVALFLLAALTGLAAGAAIATAVPRWLGA